MSPSQELADEVNRRSILMVCNGRARAGWAIVVVWDDPEVAEVYRVFELPPGSVTHAKPGAVVEVLLPGVMLSGFVRPSTKRVV